MKSKKTLDSFVAYCIDNPDQRFWQALRNWSKYDFIYGVKSIGAWVTTMINCEGQVVEDFEDTFYKED